MQRKVDPFCFEIVEYVNIWLISFKMKIINSLKAGYIGIQQRNQERFKLKEKIQPPHIGSPNLRNKEQESLRAKIDAAQAEIDRKAPRWSLLMGNKKSAELTTLIDQRDQLVSQLKEAQNAEAKERALLPELAKQYKSCVTEIDNLFTAISQTHITDLGTSYSDRNAALRHLLVAHPYIPFPEPSTAKYQEQANIRTNNLTVVTQKLEELTQLHQQSRSIQEKYGVRFSEMPVEFSYHDSTVARMNARLSDQ